MKRYNAAAYLFAAVMLASILPNIPAQSANNATALYNQTEQYLQRANQSAYLIFKPNLTQAYGDLAAANSLLASNNPSLASQQLYAAQSSARAAQASIERYRNISLVVLCLFAALTAIIICYQVKPYHARKIDM